MPATPARYAQRPADDLPRQTLNQARADDLDVPTFIRRKQIRKNICLGNYGGGVRVLTAHGTAC